MRFSEVYSDWEKGRLTQAEAAQILGVCDRTFRRYLARHEENSLEGLRDYRVDRISHLRAPVDEVIALQDLYRTRFLGWSVKHFDRGSHYWHTPTAGGKVDKKNLTQLGGAMNRLGIAMIAAYSPEARGRSERMFRTHQEDLL